MRPFVAGAALATAAALASPLPSEELTFAAAWERALGGNEALAAARKLVDRRREERGAARALRWPRLEAAARATRLDEPLVIDLDPIRQVILRLAPGVPAAAVPAFEEVVQEERFWKADLRLTVPLFAGGRIDAAGRAAEALVREAEAQERTSEGSVSSELVRRYFALRLARRVLEVRADVLSGMERHVYEARRLEEEGLVARTERLHAEVARAEAERQVKRSTHDLELARTALANTLAAEGPLEAATPLFVVRHLEPVEAFRERAEASNPALAGLGAARAAAAQATRAERAAYFPEVFLFGARELHEHDLTVLEPTWAVGVGVRLSLFDGFGRERRVGAARRQEERLELLAGKSRRDVGTLVERAHREAEKARDQHDALGAARALAAESLETRTRAFEEGLGTSLEVVDARLALARVELERLVASYEQVVALADLLEAAGEPGRFEELRAGGEEVER